MPVLDRATLDASTLADLHAIASELSIDGYRRLRKADLIDALIVHQGGRPSRRKPATAEVETELEAAGQELGEDTGQDADESANGTARRRRGRRGGRGRGAAGRPSDQSGADDEAETPEAPASEPAREEPETVEGVVELLPNGSGFVRLNPPEQSDQDVYISAAQVKRCELVSGDRISGPRRAPHRSERYPSLIRIDTVNGGPASEISDRARFDDMPAAFPADRLKLGSDDATLKAIDSLTPFGRGSRVTIVGDSWAGKSHLLRTLAEALLEQKDLAVLTVLAGVRPEEIAEWSESPAAPKAAVSFAGSVEAQDHAVELVIDQAKRLATRGEHAVVLIDTLDGLQELTARKALAAARNIPGAGSLTVIATATEPRGGETTVIALNAAQAMLGKFPALDLVRSGTIRAEQLVGKTAANAIVKERVKALK